MSILLDSLRKSEAQRKVGEAPSIHSTQQYGPHSGHPKQWLALAMMGVTAAAIAWFGMQQYADPEPPGSAQVAVKTGETTTQTTAHTTANTTDPGRKSPARVPKIAGEEARTPVERLSQQADPEGPANAAEQSTSPGRAQDITPAERIAGFTAQEQPAEAGAADQAPAPERGVENPPAETAPPQEGMEELARVERESPQRRSRVEPPESEPLSYWQLPQSLRNDLPKFRITVLVYADAPEDRFLLINGERLREGEDLEGGVVLEEIRRDGAVFSYRQYRFLVRS